MARRLMGWPLGMLEDVPPRPSTDPLSRRFMLGDGAHEREYSDVEEETKAI
jgi:hypothetical protein